jgi:hypothetical protein
MEEAMSWLYLIPGLICLIIGAGFLLLFRYSNTKENELGHRVKAKAWAKLTDTGSRIEDRYNNRTYTVYFGIYEYDTDDGQHISSASDFAYGNPNGIPGAQGNMVKIRYNPNSPTEFILLEEQVVSKAVLPSFRKVGIILLVLGILFTAAAIAAILGLFDSLLDSLIKLAENGNLISYSLGSN